MGFKNNHSPLRYPGGKAILANFLADVIERNKMTGRCVYYEPYTGGAGAAITLLKWGVVSRIRINDYDSCITAFWKLLIYDTKAFIKRIEECPLNIQEWQRQREIYDNAKHLNYNFDVGFATFYLNRCNRSGILPKAGPIGGRKQEGRYRLDSRFKRDVLICRIMEIAALKDRIEVFNLDALDFLRHHVMTLSHEKNAFVYLDPPYYIKGQDLYLNAYNASDHIALANFIKKQSTLKWIMSYDSTSEIKALYKKFGIHPLDIQYSAQKVRKEKELLIVPKQTKLPEAFFIKQKNDNSCIKRNQSKQVA